MIILDTNIVSEFMTSSPASTVFNWLNTQSTTSLYLTTITIAEIEFGLHAMPHGKRQKLLTERFQQFVATAFDQRILSFDLDAAKIYGAVLGHRREIGRPMTSIDGQIASIARARNFSVATRNIKDFEECQIELINPFSR
jgi:predicted nucleic acid-binding protein